ncbi:transposase [Methanomethylovorans hollandica DSM 15978]|jgi:putative transposase|uniref:Transposase n=1 Tax=Methanomethylovorans hollandica (strain DSM 15978 / NBRC 107637 / DMS1) TaxID=867904 RepID=L0KYC9_METHD|nr:transposase [Methanomethylovorans hollandica DSM 15978]
MAKPEQIPIEHHLSSEELLKRIKSLEKDTRVLQRLYFVKHRYEGASVAESAKLVGTSKPVAYQWQERWNKDGYDGLIPRFAGGCPSKLLDEQKEELKEILHQRDDWSTKEVKELIFNRFNVIYTGKQILEILKKFGMHHAKPYSHDYRRPEDAEDSLKKLTRD